MCRLTDPLLLPESEQYDCVIRTVVMYRGVEEKRLTDPLLLPESEHYDCVICAVVMYRGVEEKRLTDPLLLPESENYDCVMCGCTIDLDFDGENEVLIGTYGQVSLRNASTVISHV